MAPVVHGLEAEYTDQITFSYLDIDDAGNEGFKEALGFRYQPQFFLLDGEGQVVDSWAGQVSEAEFRSAFDRLLEESS